VRPKASGAGLVCRTDTIHLLHRLYGVDAPEPTWAPAFCDHAITLLHVQVAHEEETLARTRVVSILWLMQVPPAAVQSWLAHARNGIVSPTKQCTP